MISISQYITSYQRSKLTMNIYCEICHRNKNREKCHSVPGKEYNVVSRVPLTQMDPVRSSNDKSKRTSVEEVLV